MHFFTFPEFHVLPATKSSACAQPILDGSEHAESALKEVLTASSLENRIWFCLWMSTKLKERHMLVTTGKAENMGKTNYQTSL